MTAVRRVEWQGVDDPSRRDAALVRFEADALLAAGSSVSDEWTSAWSLDVGAGWLTRRLVVRSQGPGWARSLRLERDGGGRWSARGTAEGDADLPAPGIDDIGLLDDALDCDLGLNPVTNTMPIRRLDLLARRVPETRLLMAWVDVPSLAVLASRQLYASADPSLQVGHEVDYLSQDRGFHARLSVEPDGLVVDYPQLARRTGPAGR
jgi:uncharacterized protein